VKKTLVWLVLLAFLAPPAWSQPPEVDPKRVITLLISANVHGEVAPCG